MSSNSMSYYAHTLSPNKSVIDIPPRKLLTRGARPAPLDGDNMNICMLSPRFSSADEALLQRFLPCNGGDDDDTDPYGSDHFRMYEFKVRRCTRSRSHDWTDCPFAHPGEKARRRDPRRFHYSGTVCPEYRRGGCARGDNCEFAHGVFECWLHPARYRTEACKDGKNCKRKVCFFAHTARELRVLPLHSPVASGKHHRNNGHVSGNHCCLLCCHATSSSPTSTLLSSSPPMSPPMKHRSSLSGLSPFSRFLNNSSEHASPQMGGPQFYSSPTNYKDTLDELMCSLDAMRFSDAVSGSPVSGAEGNYGNALWVEDRQRQQQQFLLSPSTSSVSNNYVPSNNMGGSCDPDHPDLGWVNDLLM